MTMWRRWALAIFGAWFVLSAWILNPVASNAYTWTAIILGGLTLIGSVWALVDRRRLAWRDYLFALFGLYLALTPWFYGFVSQAGMLWTTLLVGAATLAAGLWEALDRSEREASHGGAPHARAS
jgi:hypothetical protein